MVLHEKREQVFKDSPIIVASIVGLQHNIGLFLKKINGTSKEDNIFAQNVLKGLYEKMGIHEQIILIS